ASSTANSSTEYVAGGYFGNGMEPAGFKPLFRRPSLTPISERSESSYRNSMVFPVVASPFGSHPGSPIGPGYLGHGLGGGSIGGEGEEMSLSQMLKQVNMQNGFAGGMSPYGAMTPVYAPQEQELEVQEGEMGYVG